MYDVIIVGGGVLGLSTGIALMQKDPNLKVIVFDSDYASATEASGGMINVFAEVETETLATDAGRNKFNLAVEAQRHWMSEPWEHLLSRDWRTTVVSNSIGPRNNYAAIKKALVEYGKPHDIDKKPVGFDPSIQPYETVTFVEPYVDPVKTITEMRSAFANLGGWLRSSSHITRIAKTKDQFRIYCTDFEIERRYEAPKVVVCAGAYTYDLVKPLSNILPIYHGVGCGMLLETDIQFDGVIRTPVRSASCGITVVPRLHNQVYVGASNRVSRTPKKSSVQTYINIINSAMTEINKGLGETKWKTFYEASRPVSLDGFPLLGETDVDGLYVLSGTRRDGLTCAPVYSTLMAEEVYSGTAYPIFRPNRDPIWTLTRDQGIAKLVEANKVRAIQHGNTYNNATSHYEREATEIYDRLELDHGVHPEMIDVLLEERNENDMA